MMIKSIANTAKSATKDTVQLFKKARGNARLTG